MDRFDSEITQFNRLSNDGKLSKYLELLVQYNDINNRATHSETKLRNLSMSITKKIQQRDNSNKPRSNKAVIRTKSHSAAAAALIIILGHVPWVYIGFTQDAVIAWTPLLSSAEFVALFQMFLTWSITETDHVFKSK